MASLPSKLLLAVLITVLAANTGVVVAPFPPEHYYHFLNPWIEPWWVHLDKGEQDKIYGKWEKIEPLLLDLADKWEAKKAHHQEKLGNIVYHLKQTERLVKDTKKADKKKFHYWKKARTHMERAGTNLMREMANRF